MGYKIEKPKMLSDYDSLQKQSSMYVFNYFKGLFSLTNLMHACFYAHASRIHVHIYTHVHAHAYNISIRTYTNKHNYAHTHTHTH